jgi:transcriptional regulator with XRE-family HTH domain
VAFSEKCESQQSISRRLGVTQSTILRVQNRVRGTGANTRRLEKGYNAAQDRFLRLRTLKQRFVTSSSLSQDFSRRYNIQISQNTLRQRLAEHHLLLFVPATGPLLTTGHRKRRLEFTRDHLNWQEAD